MSAKREKEKRQEQKSMKDLDNAMGVIVDAPLNVFKDYIVNDTSASLGDLENLLLFLKASYERLRISKDAVIRRIEEGTLRAKDRKVKKNLNELYAEMTKIEDKVLFLKGHIDTIKAQWKPD